MTDVVVFLDALSPRELAGVLDEWYQGDMDAGTPRVTPRVMSSIYTGLPPSQNGMMEVSRHGGERTTRPRKSTFIDKAIRQDMSILSMGMPFCIPFQGVNNQSVLHGDALQGAEQVVPPQAGQLVQVPAPQGDMIRSHPDRVFASFKDQTYAYFNTFKENIRRVDPDVAFIGYRSIDSYCHFQHTERRQGKPYRQHLIDDVEYLVRNIAEQIDGEALVFSDHGQTELTDVFRVNRWLKDNGWLDYKVDYDFIDTLEEYTGGEQHPIQERVEHQFTFGRPGVTLNQESSKVVCSDPFDSCLTLLCDREEFPAEEFRQDLLDTGLYRSVDYKWELYDEDDDYYDETPDIIPDRDEGVFVSGNLHDNPIGMGYYRTGVHDYHACFGSTRDLAIPEGDGRDGMITPEQMYDVITDFMDLGDVAAPMTADDVRGFTVPELERMQDEIGQVIKQ